MADHPPVAELAEQRQALLRRPLCALELAQILQALPADVIAAKNRLRDRLVPPVAGQVREVLALRRARRYEPDPGLNLVGVGVGEKVTSGARTGVPCVKVLVARKFAKSQKAPRPSAVPAIRARRSWTCGVGW